ncbi:hypothetical protein [Novilysobacter spongiicola]|uniref:Uncharacterized protein n=1 Tax=Lysobacter spongiicola DSM 21749 TaxID=1122188 RepID=A0A1T4SID2_9GAMM|nr:hypothetical protein [Lysobacter spongiicola]SKA27913.1 hypothetical protein SAMN02745674_02881 [Lysobacter spongiicola DSM 21749]
MLDKEQARKAILALLLVAASGCSTMGRVESPVTWSDSYGMDSVPAPDAEDWTRWMAQPWQVDGEPRVSIVLDDDGNEVEVRSCEELFRADERGWTGSYLDGRIQRAWASTCYGARAIAGAVPAARSHLEGFVLDESSVRALPVLLGTIISGDNERTVRQLHAAVGTLGDYIGEAVVVTRPDGGATIENDWGGRQGLTIKARGDFNHDGVADLLLSTSSWIPGASHWSHGLWIITRDAPGAPLRVVEEIPVMGLL